MSGHFPNWIARLLGVPLAPGEGLAWSLEHSLGWYPWLVVVFAFCMSAFVVWVYLREAGQRPRWYRLMLACVRLTLIALAVLMIAQVTLVLQRTGLPYVALLLDDSLSMTIVDRYEQSVERALRSRLRKAAVEATDPSRWSILQMLLTEHDAALLHGLADDYKLRVYLISGQRLDDRRAEEIATEVLARHPVAESTPLGAAVRNILDEFRGSLPAAIVILSDGINTEGPSLAEAAALAHRRGVPLLLVGIGSDQPVRNLAISNLLAEKVVFVGDVVNFEFQLVGTGFQGAKVPVVLRSKQDSDVLARTEVTVGPDGQPQQVRFPYRPTQLGEFQYVIELQPQEGELRSDDNRLEHSLQVREEKVRVLFVQGYPSYEYRFLRNMLGREPSIELHVVLQEADLQHAQQDAAVLASFPLRREEVFSYDVIIFGDVNPAWLSTTALENVAEFVRQPGKGGALVLIAGPRYMPAAYRDSPLAPLMPVELNSLRYPDAGQVLSSGFRVRPTELGLSSPPMQLGDTPEQTAQIWQNLPPLYWLLESPDLKPGTRVLAEHPEKTGPDGRALPVICLQYVGAGKVLFHATDETHRWRWRVGDLYFARYWVQMLRFLARSKLLESKQGVTLATDQAEYSRGASVRLLVRFDDERLAPPEDDGVELLIRQAGQPDKRLRLHRAGSRGVFEGVLHRPPPGRYRATLTLPAIQPPPTVDFVVQPPPGEFERVRMDAEAMRSAAKQTHGRFYTLDNAHQLLHDLPAGRQAPIETLPPIPLWNRWPVVLVFLCLLVGEWILRKLGGMV